MKTKGSKDLKKRKSRSDKNRHRSQYAGNSTKKKRSKNGKLILYKSKRKVGDPVKVWIWERKKMSRDGYLRWNVKQRRNIRPVITKFIDKPFYIDPLYISSEECLKSFIINYIQYPGTFLLMMPTHSKNTHRVSYKSKARVKIKEVDGHLSARVSEYGKLRRYWFWKK